MSRKKLAALLVLIFSLHSLQTHSSDFKGSWAGIEVMGCDSKTAQKIRNMIPIKVGDPFNSGDVKVFKQWCSQIKNNLNIQDANCSFVGYQDGKYYFDVEVISSNKHKKFRKIPHHFKLEKLPSDLNILLSEWEAYTLEFFKAGKPRTNFYKN